MQKRFTGPLVGYGMFLSGMSTKVSHAESWKELGKGTKMKSISSYLFLIKSFLLH